MIPGLSWAKLAIAVVVLLGAGATGWQLNGWRLGTQLADDKAAYAQNLQHVSDAATKAAQEQEQKLEAAQQAIAALDAQHTEEMQHVQADAAAAHAALADGTRQLSITASCPSAGGNIVPGATPATGVDHGSPASRAVIDGSAAQALVALAAKGDGYRVQLAACQDYARTLQSVAQGHP
jgi:hypothetical protein